MPEGGGLRATQEIQRCAPGTAIVALSVDESDAVVRDVVNAGAMAYVRKGAPSGELAETLHRSIRAHAGLKATADDSQLPA
jgi:DNA-binding NarL/FixJ family response regulator